MGIKDFFGFNFSFRLTFADSTTRKNWYQSVTISNHNCFHSAFRHLGKLLALNLIVFAGSCWLGTNNQLDQLNLGLNLLPSDQTTTQLFRFIFTDCKFFLILLGGALPFTKISGWLIAIWAVLTFTTLSAAGIVGIDPGFGGSIHRLTYCFPGLQVVLVIAFGVGSRAFYRLVMVLLLYLDLVLFLSKQVSCFTTPGSSIVFTDCQSFLILLSGALPLDSMHLVQWLENANRLTDVSGRSWF